MPAALPPADIARIAAQRSALRVAIATDDDRRTITSRSDGGRYRFKVATTPAADGSMLMVSGRIVLRKSDLADPTVANIAQNYVQTQDACLTALGLVQLQRSEASDQTIGNVKALRNAGALASLDQILPLNHWVMKGDGGAEPTDRRLGSRPRSSKAGRGVLVAVVDGGINVATHDGSGHHGRTDGWLAGIPVGASNTDPLVTTNLALGNTFPGMPATPATAYLDDAAGHGTFVAGIVRRVAPAVSERVYRIFNSDGIANDESVACAILSAGRAGADVINLSLGATAVDGIPPLATGTAIARLPKKTVVVAAAGNNGTSQKVYPAAFKGVVAVGAMDYTGRHRAGFSSLGSWVDVSTVGEGVVSTYVDGVERPAFDPDVPDSWSGRNPIAMWSGTSFAAPQVAGLIARLTPQAGSAPKALAQLLRAFKGKKLAGSGEVIPILEQ